MHFYLASDLHDVRLSAPDYGALKNTRRKTSGKENILIEEYASS